MPDGNDVFNSIQMDIQYEGCINEARAYLDAGEYDKAISAAERARGYLRSDRNSSEVDAFVSSVRSAMAQAEKDARELAQREAEEKRKIADQERLARQQEEQKKRQAAQEEQERKRKQAAAAGKAQRVLQKCAIIAFLLLTAYVIYQVFTHPSHNLGAWNFSLLTFAYLAIIGIWSLLNKLLGYYGMAGPMASGLIVFGGVYSYIAGANIIECYLYDGIADSYGYFWLSMLGVNDFFVLKYMGISIVMCVAVVLIFTAIGKIVDKSLK